MSGRLERELYGTKNIRFSKATGIVFFLILMLIWGTVLYIHFYDRTTLYYSAAGVIIAVTIWGFGWLFKNHQNKFLQKVIGYNDYRSIVWDPRATWRTTRIFMKWMFINVGVFAISNPRGLIKDFAALQNPMLYSFYEHIFIGIVVGQIILFLLWLFIEFPKRNTLLKMKSSGIVYAINILTFLFVATFLSISLPTVEYFENMNKNIFSFWYVMAGVNMVPRLLLGSIDADARRLSTLKKYQIPGFLEQKINHELNDISFLKSKKLILFYALFLGFFYQFARVTWTFINFYVFWSEIARIRTQYLALYVMEQPQNDEMYNKKSKRKLYFAKRRINQVLAFSEVMYGLAEVQKGVLRVKKKKIEEKKKMNERDMVEKATFSFELDKAENFKAQSLKIRYLAQYHISMIYKEMSLMNQRKAEILLRKKMDVEQQCFKLEKECLDEQQQNPITQSIRKIRLYFITRKGDKIQRKAELIFNDSLSHNMRAAYFKKEADTHVPMKSAMRSELGLLSKNILNWNEEEEETE